MFYLCTETGCNRKYKTLEKVTMHITQTHQILVDPTKLQLVEITKENKKNVEADRERNIKKAKQAETFAELQHKRDLEIRAKAIADAAHAERYITLEAERLRLAEESTKLQAMYLKRVNDSEECCICMEAPRESAIVPCGHKFFCNPCIVAYHAADSRKGCPVCRSDIVMITKIFE